MGWLNELIPTAREYLPLALALVAIAAALAVTHTLARLREKRSGKRSGLARQVAMLTVTALGVVVLILSLPISDGLKGQLLGLLGLLLTAVVAFSSTTFVANAMAGLMLRAVGNFRPGDWLRVGDQFGRVTERGLFHTEIQTEDRDLTTLPNLYLVTNPVKVVADSGTVLSATLSLGYDLDHQQIEALLVAAAETSGLEEPFVHVVELGDFSVRYRVAGLAREVRHLLSARSRLHTCVLDTLHGAGVEIVSPAFMNQRRLEEGARFVPTPSATQASPEAPPPEERIFDKADEQASLEEQRAELERLTREVEALKTARSAATDDGEKSRLESEIESRQAERECVAARLESQVEE